MTAERIDPTDWPATISVGPGWYGLRIDTDHGTAVHYLDASALMVARSMDGLMHLTDGAGTSGDPGSTPGRSPFPAHPMRAHAGARCEEAA